MNTEMCLLTIMLSGPESEARAGLKPDPALSWFLVMLVTSEKKKEDLVLHVSRAKGEKWFHLLPFTVHSKQSLTLLSF